MEVKSRRFLLPLALLLLLGIAKLNWAQERPSEKPFFKAREQQSEYAGPGREDPEPQDLSEVRLGYFGPSDPTHPQGGDIWLAVDLAIEEANKEGGYRGIPFRLIPGWSENPWGTGVSRVARMAFYDEVWAIIGGIDGPSTHLAEQVVAKAHLTLISPASTDKTVNLANVPWMFSLVPGDHLLAPVVGKALLDYVVGGPFTLISATDHDSHVFMVELRNFLSRRRVAPHHQYDFKSGTRDFSELAERVTKEKPKAVALAAGAIDSAHLLIALREKGYAGPLFGGPSFARRTFLKTAGPAANGVILPLLEEPGDRSKRFAEDFFTRFGFYPDYAAAYAYDSTGLLVAAIRKAGLNRASIRDAVQQLSPWEGVTGTITWDPLGQNTRPVQLATIKEGRIVPFIAAVEGASLGPWDQHHPPVAHRQP